MSALDLKADMDDDYLGDANCQSRTADGHIRIVHLAGTNERGRQLRRPTRAYLLLERLDALLRQRIYRSPWQDRPSEYRR
jgi:hypothetical protein